MIGAKSRTRVSAEQVREIMDRPPRWLAGSYIPAYKSGRYPLEVLAYAVVAALKIAGHGVSAYDDEVVDEVTSILEGVGYGGEVAATWV